MPEPVKSEHIIQVSIINVRIFLIINFLHLD